MVSSDIGIDSDALDLARVLDSQKPLQSPRRSQSTPDHMHFILVMITFYPVYPPATGSYEFNLIYLCLPTFIPID